MLERGPCLLKGDRKLNVAQPVSESKHKVLSTQSIDALAHYHLGFADV
jgi:hypothetical protein